MISSAMMNIGQSRNFSLSNGDILTITVDDASPGFTVQAKYADITAKLETDDKSQLLSDETVIREGDIVCGYTAQFDWTTLDTRFYEMDSLKGITFSK